jgi:hypothetical protein
VLFTDIESADRMKNEKYRLALSIADKDEFFLSRSIPEDSSVFREKTFVFLRSAIDDEAVR